MQKDRFYYILEIQYLGFRYHGWQRQPNVLTVEKMIRKTLNFVLPKHQTKVLASGRTDAKVSAEQTYIELFTVLPIENLNHFFHSFNKNLPADIRLLGIQETNATFNIIQSPKIKEYHYYFAHGEKFHPFAAAFMCHHHHDLDIELMQSLAPLFTGTRDFYSYTFRPNPETKTVATIDHAELVKNTDFTASFFPDRSYVLKVIGRGFKRNQIRLMMGALFDVGSGEMSVDAFKATLNGSNRIKLSHIAPPSGLLLHKVQFLDE
ncbi:MAG: tRNA pseudouridine synthase A [Bacteroidota bacterium]